MTNDSRPANSNPENIMSADLELLHCILDPSPAYPWNPYTPESEAYLSELESQWDGAGTEEAIAAGWQTLSAQLTSLWPTDPSERVAALVKTLSQHFTVTLPEQVLKTLAEQAMALTNTGRPLMEQLVQCAQSVLNGWDAGDLEVLARPLALSLRDGRGEMLDLHIRSLQQANWSTLSEIDRARLSLAMASFALGEIKATE